MSKRQRGNGTVKQLPNGRWLGKVSWIDAAGKRHQPSRVFDKRSQARSWVHEQQDKINKGIQADAGRRTVADWLTEWLELKQSHIEANTYRFYATNVRLYIVPNIGKVQLAKLRPAAISGLYTTLAKKGVTKATQRHAGVTLSAALNDAVKHSYLASNPAR